MSPNPTSVERVKQLIIESLNLDGMTPEQIGDDDPLFGDGLGLDSVDALELVVAMEKAYKIKIKSHEIDPQVFRSASSLSSYIDNRVSAGEGRSA